MGEEGKERGGQGEDILVTSKDFSELPTLRE